MGPEPDSNDPQGAAGSDDTSFSAEHSTPQRRPLHVAPTDGSSRFNTIRIPLIPIACWRLNDPAFAFDSSFISSNFRGEFVPTGSAETSSAPPGSALATLSGIVSQHPGCVASLFAHCDPAGSDTLNKTLGDRRAIAVYALLTRQPSLWAYLYDNPQVGDQWDLRMVQLMLQSVPDGDGNPYFAGQVTGVRDRDTSSAVKRFQSDAGLAADGDPGSQTRKALFGAYMDWLCTPSAGSDSSGTSTPTPFRMQPSDFLGGTGAQPGDLPGMSLQSCGKFNPIVLLSTTEMGGDDTTDGASKVQRNADDAPNRRVIMFLFPKGTKVDPSLWPCPKVKESNDACKAVFWPDGDSRRRNGEQRRDYRNTRDTMACRFYDRFARRSPCESGVYKRYPFGVFADLDSWIGAASLQLLRSDGSVAQTFRVSDGIASGGYRVFYFRIRQGAQYSAALVGDGGTLSLFDPTVLSDVFVEADPAGLAHEAAPSFIDDHDERDQQDPQDDTT